MTFAFQPQNPAINGFYLGWSSCTTYAAAMAASYDRGVAKACTGEQVRRWTGDYSGGTTLAQVDEALREHVNVNLDTQYRMSWDAFARRINNGQGAVLQLWYQAIANTRFDAGGGFIGNHGFFIPPGWGAADPLADGRRAGIYKYHGEPYPQSLLKTAAGQLNIGAGRIVRLGSGLVYAAFTRDKEASYKATVGNGKPGYPFFVYSVSANGVITGRQEKTTGGFSATCTAPRLYRWPAQDRSISLVQLTSGYREDQYISAKLAHEV